MSKTINSIDINDNSLIINYDTGPGYNCVKGGCIPVTKGAFFSSKAQCDLNCGSRPYAQGINRWPTDYGSKVEWMYVAVKDQGDACTNPPVKAILKTRINYLSMICNLSIQQPSDLSIWTHLKSGEPGEGSTQVPPNGTKGPQPCRQHQVTLPYSKGDLKRLHEKGVTIALCLGSWCSYFPNKGDYNTYWKGDLDTNGCSKTFLNHFNKIRDYYSEGTKGKPDYVSYIDGIDIDWEGYCKKTCLQDNCGCDWDKGCKDSGGMSLANSINIKGEKADTCWTLVDETTINVLNIIGTTMKTNGYTCTAVPMSTQMYGYNSIFTKANSNGQNQFIEYNLDFDKFDGIMLQWYGGFDAGICGANSYPIKAGQPAGLCKTNAWQINDNPNYATNAPLHCPRSIDCPDWGNYYSYTVGPYTDQYEVLYADQLAFFYNLKNTMKATKSCPRNLEEYISRKIIIGIEFWTADFQWGPEPRADYIYGLDQALIKGFDSLESNPKGGWTTIREKEYKGYDNSKIAENGLAGFGGWTIYGTMDNKYYNKGYCEGMQIYNTFEPKGYKGYKGCCPFPRWKYFREQIENHGGPWRRDPKASGNKGQKLHKGDYIFTQPPEKLCGTMMNGKWTKEYTPKADKGGLLGGTEDPRPIWPIL